MSKHVKIQNLSLAGKTLTKKQNVVAILIDDHFSYLSKVFIKSNSLKKYILELLFQKKKKKKNQNCSLKKYISKFLPRKIYFKNSPKQFIHDISKNYDAKYINIMDLIAYGQNIAIPC